jgi:hypothetical protein
MVLAAVAAIAIVVRLLLARRPVVARHSGRSLRSSLLLPWPSRAAFLP